MSSPSLASGRTLLIGAGPFVIASSAKAIFRPTAAGWKIRCYIYNASQGAGTPQ